MKRLAMMTGWMTALWLALSSVAHASCVAPAFKLLWTYPEAGAKDVPTNAELWALSNQGGVPPVATLNGKPLAVESPADFNAYRMLPGSLQPNQAYVLVLDYSGAPGMVKGPETRIEINFSTGAAAAPQQPDSPAVAGYSQRASALSDVPCSEVVFAQSCFDGGQDTLLSFDVTSTPETLGWVVGYGPGSGWIWPAGCGKPGSYVEARSAGACYFVQRIGAGGRLSEPMKQCVSPTPPSSGAAGASGHAAAGETASAGRGPAGGAAPDQAGGGGTLQPIAAGRTALPMVAGNPSTAAAAGVLATAPAAPAASSCQALPGARGPGHVALGCIWLVWGLRRARARRPA